MKKIPLIISALLLVTILIFCASPQKNQSDSSQKVSNVTEVQSSQNTQLDNPETTPEPTPLSFRDVSLCGKTFSTGNAKLDLSNIKHSDVSEACAILKEMPNLEYVEIGDETNGLTWDDISLLYEAAPNARFSYGFTLYNQAVNTYDKVLDFNHYAVGDEGAAVMKILPYMRNCTTLDMDSCGVSNESMDAIRKAFPNIEVIWRIWMAANYSFRTNVTKILASKPTVGGNITDEDAQQFKYCTKLKFLDLGHNEELTDFSFISYLTDLRVAVVSITLLHDLTPFENCQKLFYLEAGNTKISDLSPLAKCKKLKHLNVGTCFDVKDISCLYDLSLTRLWLGSGDPVPSEQVAKMKELHPGIEIDTTCPTGLEGGTFGLNEGFVMGKWKSYKQYLLADWQVYQNTGFFPAQHPKGIFRIVYDGFEYALNPACYSFPEYDPLYNEHDSIYPTNHGSAVNMQEDKETGVVRYLITDPKGLTEEALETWNKIADEYTTKTGVPVTILTGIDRDVALTDVDEPTLFEVNGPVDLRKYSQYCYDLSSSDVYSQLISKEYATKDDGKVLGVARDFSNYGILVNKELLSKYGYTVDDIKNFDSLKTIVAAITDARNVTSNSAAFVSSAMNDLTETGLTNRLANVMIMSEFKEDGIELRDYVEGRYFDNFMNFWNMVIYNQNCSYYDLSPAAPIQRTNEDSCREFIEEYAVFFICGDEIWNYIKKDGRMSEDNIGYVPLYMGIGDESKQGLCSGTDCYWSVNSKTSEANIQATLDFLKWLVTSDYGTQSLSSIGLEIPYKEATESENPFIKKDRENVEKGLIPITTDYAMYPSDSWKDEVNYEMAAYSANLGDRGDIFGEICTVWEGEYAIK